MPDFDHATWYKDAVFYELYVRAFKDGNNDGHGDLRGLLTKLDYLQALGVDCIWLLPINPSPLVDDGYDVADYRDIHPDFGTLEDFKVVVDGIHARGMRIIIDVVLNHSSHQHPWFVESRSSRDNPRRDWYVWSSTDQRYRDARVIFLDTLSSNWTYDELTGEFFWHRFFAEQPDLNYDNPAVVDEMLGIMDFWLQLGVDGFRIDAVPYLIEREDTNCENLPETHAIVKRIRAFMDAKWPGRIMLAEANQWPEDVREYFGDGDEFNMAFHFPIMPRLYMALKQNSRRSIVDILHRTPSIPPDAQWCIFLRNHDELTLEMVTLDEREFMWAQYAPEPRMRLNLGIRRRLAPMVDNDPRRLRVLNALLFSLPGSPIIYYGDEIGMGDDVWRQDRQGVRTPMQWDGSPNAGFSNAASLYEDVIRQGDFGYENLNVALQQATPDSLWYAVRHMLTVRKQHRAFGRGTFEFALPENEAVLSYWRVLRADASSETGKAEAEVLPPTELERLLVVVNLSDAPQQATLDLSGYAGCTPVDVLTGQAWAAPTAAPYTFELEPYAYAWLQF